MKYLLITTLVMLCLSAQAGTEIVYPTRAEIYSIPTFTISEKQFSQGDKNGKEVTVNGILRFPQKAGVKNVYGNLGQIFAQSTVAEPRLCAAMMGQLIQGLGSDHVVWGTDAIWTGSPQWQIEALRRLEIPEDMQKKYGFAALGPADGPVKRAIFGDNSARLYNFTQAQRNALVGDKVALAKLNYDEFGDGRTNLRYGYMQT